MKDAPLSPQTIDTLRRTLLARQRFLFRESEHVEEDLRTIEESREAEIEERAQQETMARLLDRVEERDRRELEDIQHALVKIASGRYGLCEGCAGRIGSARLKALPQARWCVACSEEHARIHEPAPRPFEPGAHRPVPEEYRDLDDDELAIAVRDRFRVAGDPDFLAITIRCHSGVVRLSGRIGGEPQRQVLRRIISDEMGLDVIDRLLVSGMDRELPGESERPREDVPNDEERIPAGHGMRPLGPERAAIPEDQGEPPETVAEVPPPEEE